MKATLKKFGDEGNNILNASDMRTALKRDKFRELQHLFAE